MDNSQSSDVFSDTSLPCNSIRETMPHMDTLTYETLLHKIKTSLCNSNQIDEAYYPQYFTTLLDDCRLCIAQGLELAGNVLLDTNVDIIKLSQYMEDTICLLQLLSTQVKNVIESIPVACCLFKTFPTTTGHIITLIFTHCKNSESVYGVHLKHLQKQLKDLFRTCHELQLTYLMVLVKYFTFDLSEVDQLDILIEALDINLKICEVVQSLDVKTMAEQWKAYIALCEKYASHLMDKHIYQECEQLICALITNNLENATQINQDEKVVTRSLKVINFSIKILLKMCTIFKHAAVRDCTHIFDLLIHIYLHNPAFLESVARRHPQFIDALSTNVSSPSDVLLKELVIDDKFMNVVLTHDINGLKDTKVFGYLMLIVAIIKCTLQKTEAVPIYPKHKLLHCIFKILPQCHVWLNIGIKFRNELCVSQQSIGFYEYVLIYAIGLAVTMSADEMCHLEQIMVEATLGTDCSSALFSSNLWVALARLSNNRQMLVGQVLSMCHVYQQLESHNAFSRSPQKLHISHTLAALYEVMHQEDRKIIFKQFNLIEDARHLSLWSVLKIKNLPKDLERNVQGHIMERYRNLSSNICNRESVCKLIQIMKLASSCSFSPMDDVEKCLVQEWMRACPERYEALSGSLTSSTLWYFEFIEALVCWTCAIDHAFYDSVNLIKVFHVILNIVKMDNTELSLLVIDLLCKLASIDVKGENKYSFAALLEEAFQVVMQSSNNIVRNKLLRLVSVCGNKRLEQIFSSSISDSGHKKAWNHLKKYKPSNEQNIASLKDRLLATSDLKYVHKCIERRDEFEQDSSVDQVHKTASSNFDFADLDTLFDNASDSEPANKKIKLDSSEVDSLLDRLENDTSILCDLNVELFTSKHNSRIKNVCDKLKNLIA